MDPPNREDENSKSTQQTRTPRIGDFINSIDPQRTSPTRQIAAWRFRRMSGKCLLIGCRILPPATIGR